MGEAEEDGTEDNLFSVWTACASQHDPRSLRAGSARPSVLRVHDEDSGGDVPDEVPTLRDTGREGCAVAEQGALQQVTDDPSAHHDG